MTEWFYCEKLSNWIWKSDCEEADCEEHCQSIPEETPPLGDGDSYSSSWSDDPDPDEASVTVYIPESDQSCHFGPGWDIENDDTMTFIEIPLDEVFGAEDFSSEQESFQHFAVDEGSFDDSDESSFGEENYGSGDEDSDYGSTWGDNDSAKGWE